MKRLLRKASFWLIPIACALVVAVLMKTVFLLGYVPTASMEPTIPAKSCILGWRLYGNLKVGDIVIFVHDDKTLVKRIAALPGDTVYFDDATKTVGVNQPIEGTTRTLVVPEGYCFLLGDNAKESIDARYWDEPFSSLDQVCATLLLPDME